MLLSSTWATRQNLMASEKIASPGSMETAHETGTFVTAPNALFQNEMIFSREIRSQRIGWNSCDAKYFVDHSSLRLPYPSAYSDLHQTQVVQEYEAATAWPLMSLLLGYDMEDMLFPRGRIDTRWFSKRWGANPEPTVRFCCRCVQEQLEKSSVSWWLLDHNLPFVAVCPTHCEPLNFVARFSAERGQGYLPHEVMGRSVRIRGHAESSAIRLAAAVAKLCRRASSMDCEKVRTWLANRPSISSIKPGEMSSMVGMTVQLFPTFYPGYPHKHIRTRRTAWIRTEDLCKDIRVDKRLLMLGIGGEEVFDLTYDVAPRNIEWLLPASTIDAAVNEVIAHSRFGKLKRQHKSRFITRCQNMLKGEESWIPYFEILLLHYLDRGWLRRRLESGPPSYREFLALTDGQLQTGLYILCETLAQPVASGETARRRDIKEFVQRDKVVPLWGTSFLGACVTEAPFWLEEIRSRGVTDVEH